MRRLVFREEFHTLRAGILGSICDEYLPRSASHSISKHTQERPQGVAGFLRINHRNPRFGQLLPSRTLSKQEGQTKPVIGTRRAWSQVLRTQPRTLASLSGRNTRSSGDPRESTPVSQELVTLRIRRSSEARRPEHLHLQDFATHTKAIFHGTNIFLQAQKRKLETDQSTSKRGASPRLERYLV